ncbi:MAG: hypothetical protein GY696_32325, partial [Gammaproteobacteria bacterium]|nr:hypothetical protein [Gammaproteobacteria bacterium]
RAILQSFCSGIPISLFFVLALGTLILGGNLFLYGGHGNLEYGKFNVTANFTGLCGVRLCVYPWSFGEIPGCSSVIPGQFPFAEPGLSGAEPDPPDVSISLSAVLVGSKSCVNGNVSLKGDENPKLTKRQNVQNETETVVTVVSTLGKISLKVFSTKVTQLSPTYLFPASLGRGVLFPLQITGLLRGQNNTDKRIIGLDRPLFGKEKWTTWIEWSEWSEWSDWTETALLGGGIFSKNNCPRRAVNRPEPNATNYLCLFWK